MIVYLDTSALVKRYIREEGSDEVVALLNSGDHVFGSIVVTQVEMAATIQKAVRMELASSKLGAEVWRDFLEHWQSFTRLNVTGGVIERACELARQYNLRGYDSLHLSAALTWRDMLNASVTFAVFDRGLWLAAQKSGMGVWPAEGAGALPAELDSRS